MPGVLCDQLGIAEGFRPGGRIHVVPDGPAAAAGVQQNDVMKMLERPNPNGSWTTVKADSQLLRRNKRDADGDA